MACAVGAERCRVRLTSQAFQYRASHTAVARLVVMYAIGPEQALDLRRRKLFEVIAQVPEPDVVSISDLLDGHRRVRGSLHPEVDPAGEVYQGKLLVSLSG